MPRHNVIGQDRRKLTLVLGFQQRLDRARRKLRERLVGRSENREGSRALQSVDETRRLHCRDERRVVLRVHGILNDVLARIHGRAADHFGHFGGSDTGHARGRKENCRGKRFAVEVHDMLLSRSPASMSGMLIFTGALAKKFQARFKVVFNARQPISRR